MYTYKKNILIFFSLIVYSFVGKYMYVNYLKNLRAHFPRTKITINLKTHK